MRKLQYKGANPPAMEQKCCISWQQQRRLDVIGVTPERQCTIGRGSAKCASRDKSRGAFSFLRFSMCFPLNGGIMSPVVVV